MERVPATYILASRRHGTLYVGATANLSRRALQHLDGEGSAFCRRHRVVRLVWFELHVDMLAAITREKRIKEWRRSWKLDLIEAVNPYWRDLSADIVDR